MSAAAVSDAVKGQKLQPPVEAEFLVIRNNFSVVDPLSYFVKIIAVDSISSLAVEMFYLEVETNFSLRILQGLFSKWITYWLWPCTPKQINNDSGYS